MVDLLRTNRSPGQLSDSQCSLPCLLHRAKEKTQTGWPPPGVILIGAKCMGGQADSSVSRLWGSSTFEITELLNSLVEPDRTETAAC